MDAALCGSMQVSECAIEKGHNEKSNSDSLFLATL